MAGWYWPSPSTRITHGILVRPRGRVRNTQLSPSGAVQSLGPFGMLCRLKFDANIAARPAAGFYQQMSHADNTVPMGSYCASMRELAHVYRGKIKPAARIREALTSQPMQRGKLPRHSSMPSHQSGHGVWTTIHSRHERGSEGSCAQDPHDQIRRGLYRPLECPYTSCSGAKSPKCS